MLKITANLKGIYFNELERTDRAEVFYEITDPTPNGRTPKLIKALPSLVIKGVNVDINGDGSFFYTPEKTQVINLDEWLLVLVKAGFVFDLVLFKFVRTERYMSSDINIGGRDVVSMEPPAIGAPWLGSVVTDVNGLIDEFGVFTGYLTGESLTEL